jgi:transcriptional regulator with XRE-family HTH domain
MPTPDEAAAVLLRRARRRREWSQAEYARRAGIPASQLCAYERSTKQPSAATLARLLAVSGATLGLADARMEQQRQAEELVDVLGLVDIVPVRAQEPQMPCVPFRELVS